MARVTMSNVARLRDCGWWARPEAQWVYTPSGPAAEFGTLVHSLVADAIMGTPVTTPDIAARETAQAAVAWWEGERERHDTWWAEPAYVLDLEGAARHIGNNIGRKYPRLAPLELAGSADIVGLGDTRIAADDGVATVVDLKTGRRENVDPASENAQLRTLALAVHLAHGVDRVRVALVFPTASGVIVDDHEYDALDLADWLTDLSEMVEAIPTSQPNPSKKACQWCPAAKSCPALAQSIEMVAPPKRLPVVMSASEIQGPDHAREMYATARAAKSALDHVWSALRAYAEANGPIDIGNGKEYGPRTTRRESISLSTRAAVDALRSELGSDDAFAAAVTFETSKASIKDAARIVAKSTGESLKAAEQRVLDSLRRVGAVKVSTSTTFDEMEKKDAAAE